MDRAAPSSADHVENRKSVLVVTIASALIRQEVPADFNKLPDYQRSRVAE